MISTLPSPGNCRTFFFSTLLSLATTSSASWAQGFDPASVYPLAAGTRPHGLALGDVNGDGLLDIVAGDSGSNLYVTSVLLRQPGGYFGPITTYPSADGSFDLTLGDLDRDGQLDLITGGNGTYSVGVQLGQPSGFGPMSTYKTSGGIITNVALGDLNGDGLPDIVLVNLGTNNVEVLLSRAGGFAPVIRYSAGPNSRPYPVALGDINGDGRLDIVTGNTESATVGVLLGQAGGFAPVVTYNAFRSLISSTSAYFMGVTLADVDGDGRLDVVASTEDALSGPTLGVLLGQASGGLASAIYYPTGGLGSHSVAVGDVNGDGWPDIVQANTRANNVGVLLGYPGGFGTPNTYSTGAASNPWKVALGDINNDRRLDLVTTNSTSSSVAVLLNATPLLLRATSTTPSSSSVGSTIALDGTNLYGAVAVVFEGVGNHAVSSGFAVNATGTQITGIVVPNGATSGRLRVVTPSGTVTSSATFTVQSPTATQTGTAASALKLYPNPTRTSTMLTLAAAPVPRPVVLLDALGRPVRQHLLPAQASTLTLDLACLPAGIYAVRCGAASCRLVIE